MNKKNIYTTLCLSLCLFLFVATFFIQNNDTIENRKLSEFPSAVSTDENGKKSFNINILSDLGAYFNDRYAFKSYVVSINGLIKGKIFQTSSVPSVVYGKNGWMYYTDSVDDFLHTNTISKREAFNIAHNVKLLQNFSKQNGAKFLFSIAPNKSSLYGNNMPFNFLPAEGENSISVLFPFLKSEGVNYLDLFEAFEKTDETLYLKRDSHWNNKGAMLAYNQIMDALNKSGENYLTVDVLREKDEIGDLNSMIFPKFAEPEWNYKYNIKNEFSGLDDGTTVESNFVQTSAKGKSENLLMFRDSFANTLIPLLSNNFKNAYYSKGLPYAVESFISKYEPDYIVAQKAERNITDYSKNPPLMTGPAANVKGKAEKAKEEFITQFENYQNNADYYKISGKISEESPTDAKIYINVGGKYYEAFCVSGQSDFEYILYLKKDEIKGSETSIEALSFDGKSLLSFGSVTVEIEKEGQK